jgi:hypothetical protein
MVSASATSEPTSRALREVVDVDRRWLRIDVCGPADVAVQLVPELAPAVDKRDAADIEGVAIPAGLSPRCCLANPCCPITAASARPRVDGAATSGGATDPRGILGGGALTSNGGESVP